jgi:hypothetical protein
MLGFFFQKKVSSSLFIIFITNFIIKPRIKIAKIIKRKRKPKKEYREEFLSHYKIQQIPHSYIKLGEGFFGFIPNQSFSQIPENNLR